MSYPPCGSALAPLYGEGLDAMPRMAQATAPSLRAPTPPAPEPGAGGTPSAAERGFLFGLQRQALHYFLDNQHPPGLFLDRQRNHGPRQAHGLCSLAATGMGFAALALASAPPYRLLTPQLAARRVRARLDGVLGGAPHAHGVVPHFADSAPGTAWGLD